MPIDVNPAAVRPSGYRWVVWGILITAYLVVFFHRLALGVVREDLTRAFEISATTFGNLGATYFYAYLVMQIPSGILADSLGAKKTVTGGMVLAGIGSILFGIAPSIQWAFAGRLLVGIGVSVVFIAILKVLSQWFPEDQFATMTGITSFMGNLGGMLGQTPLALMVVLFTWRSTFAGIGVFSLLVAFLCYVLVWNTPQEKGLPPVFQPHASEQNNRKPPTLREGLYLAVTNRYTWPGFFVFLGIFGGYVSMTGSWGNSFLQDVYGMTSASAANHLVIMILGHALGAMAVGKFSDWMKRRRRPMLLFVGTCTAAWIVLLFWNGGQPPVAVLPPLFFIMGFSSAAVVLTWSCSKDVNDPALAGIATSIVNTGGFVGAALLPVILGFVIDRYSGTLSVTALYQRAYFFCLLAVVGSLTASFFIKETHCKNIFHQLQSDTQKET